jgi:tetraacyldisaccharide 4'-kinase
LNQNYFHNLVSGRSAGLFATLLRQFLRLASVFYAAAVGLRNFCYSNGLLKTYWLTTQGLTPSHKPENTLPVISVGNLTVGGTGKTPLVLWLYTFLHRKNLKVAILTRGYKTIDPLSDEPATLAKNCPNATVIVDPDRLRAAAKAVGKHNAQVLVLDDGFQHRRLARDLDIVTIDATLPFGYEKILPAGLLREPVAAMKRAQAAVVTRADLLPEYRITKLENALRQINPNMIIARAIHAPLCARALGNRHISLEHLKPMKIFAFCGIGNPDAFYASIRKLGLNLVGSSTFADHHRYTSGDLARIFEQARELHADLVLTTEKDWTKTALLASGVDVTFACLVVELKFTAAEDKISLLIDNTLASKIPKNNGSQSQED